MVQPRHEGARGAEGARARGVAQEAHRCPEGGIRGVARAAQQAERAEHAASAARGAAGATDTKTSRAKEKKLRQLARLQMQLAASKTMANQRRDKRLSETETSGGAADADSRGLSKGKLGWQAAVLAARLGAPSSFSSRFRMRLAFL